MPGNSKADAALPVVDLSRVRRFYEGKLGLKLLQANTPVPQYQDAMYEAGGGTRVYLYQRAATRADHTVLAFEVKSIEQMDPFPPLLTRPTLPARPMACLLPTAVLPGVSAGKRFPNAALVRFCLRSSWAKTLLYSFSGPFPD
jgi:catechol 2,3-dioxygenase-like lactoylglutathione lyase family enzyme